MEHDFECMDHGSIASITPLTDAAADWMRENVDPDGGDVAIGVPVMAEPRFSLDIALAMISAGLTCVGSDLVWEMAA